MLDIKFIAENRDAVAESIRARAMKADVDAVLEVYDRTRKVKHALDENRAEQNRIAKEIPKAAPDARKALIEEGARLKQKNQELTASLEGLEREFHDAMLTIPNMLAPDTPQGVSDQQNVVIKTHLTPPQFAFRPRDHLQLGRELDLIDFEAGAKVAGSKFYFLKNEAVLLEMAVKQFALQKAMARGYTPLITPDLARNDVLVGAGFAPRGTESNTYRIEGHDLSLVATAEIAVGGIHAGEILERPLPLKYVADSHCFRVEAGGGGQESKGLYRVHQFSKIELYQFTHPDESEQALEDILALEEEIYQALGIPYRVVRICAGDLGAPAYKKYDIEAWMPGKGAQGEYGEVTSCSNCTDFQARRLNVRFRDEKTGKTRFAHTLNGTAVALSRTPVAILENFQNEDGSVTVPAVLRPLMGGIETIRKKG